VLSRRGHRATGSESLAGITIEGLSDATNVWDEVPDWGGVGALRLARSSSNALGASVWEIQPGGSQFVYHFHHGSEELLVVLRGTPTVRMHDAEHVLAEGRRPPVSTRARGRAPDPQRLG